MLERSAGRIFLPRRRGEERSAEWRSLAPSIFNGKSGDYSRLMRDRTGLKSLLARVLSRSRLPYFTDEEKAPLRFPRINFSRRERKKEREIDVRSRIHGQKGGGCLTSRDVDAAAIHRRDRYEGNARTKARKKPIGSSAKDPHRACHVYHA